ERLTSPAHDPGPSAAAGRPAPRGDLAAAAPPPPHDPGACALEVRAVAASRGARAAERVCVEAIAQHPLSVELSLLQALLLLELGRLDEAEQASRRTLYLDHQSPMAHFTAATIARRRADVAAARRGYRNAKKLAEALAPDAIVPLTEGERAG